MKQHYKITLPTRGEDQNTSLGQDEAYFHLEDAKGRGPRIRFHDYAEIFNRPGLYEQLFHRTLRCASPRKVTDLLERAVNDAGATFGDLSVLDLGAGNGMIGAELVGRGAAGVVGIDILPEAKQAAERDRPNVYDAYFDVDLSRLTGEDEERIKSHRCNCLVSIAALGFGDIPPEVFTQALSLVADDAWIAFNLKDAFFDDADDTGFSRLIKRMITGGEIQLRHLERYRHRLSVHGEPLYYYAFICRKTAAFRGLAADRIA